MRHFSRRLSYVSLAILSGYSVARGAQPGYADLVRRVAPSVVTVLAEEQSQGAAQRAADRAVQRSDPETATMRAMLQRLLAGPGGGPDFAQSTEVLGSGFVVSAEGLIVTNNHVVTHARTVRVRLSDSREVPAEVIGADAATDIALLRVKAGRLPALRLGSSKETAVGDAVIAVGNPYGLGQSVTAASSPPGAAHWRTTLTLTFCKPTPPSIAETPEVHCCRQTGGSSASPRSFSHRAAVPSVLGFAIPAETVASVIAELEAHGRVQRGYFGVSVQEVSPAIATALGVKTQGGALITAIDPMSPAQGILQVEDVLVRIGTISVDVPQLPKIAARLVPGSKVTLDVIRGGMPLSMPFTVGQLPDPPSEALLAGGPDTWVPNLALGLADTTAEVRKALKADNEPSGLIITQLRAAGAGALAGLRIGDLITHAGSRQLMAVTDLTTVDMPSPTAATLAASAARRIAQLCSSYRV